MNNIQQALSHINPNEPRDEWVTILMAIKSELGDSGKGIALAWSEQGQTFNLADFNATWQSIEAGGGVTIATLFKKAKANGFIPNYLESPIPKPIDTLDKGQSANQRLKQVSNDWQTLKSQHTPQPAPSDHGYLIKKGIKSHHVKYLPHYYDSYGRNPLILWLKHSHYQRLSGLQLIYPDGQKRFIKGTLLKGSFYRVDRDNDSDKVILCEGFATACSVLENLYQGAIAYICFTANNMETIAQYLHQRYPHKQLIICADNDHHLKTNVGLRHAKQAALLTQATVIYPPQRPHEQGTDFNDYFGANNDNNQG